MDLHLINDLIALAVFVSLVAFITFIVFRYNRYSKQEMDQVAWESKAITRPSLPIKVEPNNFDDDMPCVANPSGVITNFTFPTQGFMDTSDTGTETIDYQMYQTDDSESSLEQLNTDNDLMIG